MGIHYSRELLLPGLRAALGPFCFEIGSLWKRLLGSDPGRGQRRVEICARHGLLLGHALGEKHRQAVDTTGAGDAFIGSLAVFLAEGVPEKEAVARANLY